MTYNVFSGTLNPTHSYCKPPHSILWQEPALRCSKPHYLCHLTQIPIGVLLKAVFNVHFVQIRNFVFAAKSPKFNVGPSRNLACRTYTNVRSAFVWFMGSYSRFCYCYIIQSFDRRQHYTGNSSCNQRLCVCSNGAGFMFDVWYKLSISNRVQFWRLVADDTQM